MSVRKRPGESKWYASYRALDGKERARRFTRKADAERWIATEKAALIEGRWIDPRAAQITFGEFASDWLDGRSIRPTTMLLYEGNLRNHVYPTWGARPIGSIRPSELEKWLAALGEQLAPTTVQTVWRITAMVFRAAVRDRLLVTAPTDGVRAPRADGKRIDPLTPNEVQALIEAGGRYRALVALAAGSGMRLSEDFGVTTSSLDMLRREVAVDRQLLQVGSRAQWGPPKSPSAVRTIPLADATLYELARHQQKHRPGVDGVLFTSEAGLWLRRSSFSRNWSNIVERSGIDRERVTFHELRHFYASLLIRAGESVKVVQTRLGHASASETLDTYSHIWPDDTEGTRSAVDQALGRAAGGQPATFASQRLVN